MKKICIILVAVFALALSANAQKAIGIRAAYGSDPGVDISCQINMGSNRLELNLGCFSQKGWGSYANLTALNQWKGSIAGNFGWFAGVGANVGCWMNNDELAEGDGKLGVGADAQVGVDYQFQALPVRLSLDARPQWDFIGFNSGFSYSVALGLRFCL